MAHRGLATAGAASAFCGQPASTRLWAARCAECCARARFERRFAIAALATEVHDVLVTLGVIALVQREFDMTVLASVLAVIGYSINDKVVVFDRIRELFRLARKAER